MGTSKSFDGPKDRHPLLPPWAFPDPIEEPASLPPEQSTLDDGGSNSPDTSTPSTDPQLPLTLPTEAASVNSTKMPWRSAKIALGKAALGGGGRSALSRAGRHYVRANGGSRRAATSARTGQSATRKLGGFLSAIGAQGIQGALQQLGLSSWVGKPAESVFAAISNALAPDAGSRESMFARQAINEALEGLYEQYVMADGDITNLDQMGSKDIMRGIETAVSAYIYNRWLGELQIVIEQKSISAKDAVRLERNIKAFVRESVHLDLQGKDVLSIDWQGSSGQNLINTIFTEAYSFLEDSQ